MGGEERLRVGASVMGIGPRQMRAATYKENGSTGGIFGHGIVGALAGRGRGDAIDGALGVRVCG